MTALPPTSEPVAEPISPQLRFKQVRDELIGLEKLKAAGGTVDLKRVQSLTNEIADLIAKIQTSTTGPKKKVELADGELREGKKPRTPKAPNPNLMSADDF